MWVYKLRVIFVLHVKRATLRGVCLSLLSHPQSRVMFTSAVCSPSGGYGRIVPCPRLTRFPQHCEWGFKDEAAVRTVLSGVERGASISTHYSRCGPDRANKFIIVLLLRINYTKFVCSHVFCYLYVCRGDYREGMPLEFLISVKTRLFPIIFY